MKALILAAGYARRLYPLTRYFPKPLLCVGHQPIINYIIDKLVKVKDIDEIIIVTNSKFIGRFRQWRKSLAGSIPIKLVDDLTKDIEHSRGAIGDINFVIKRLRLKDALLVIGGDNIFDGDLEKFLTFSKTKKPHPVMGVYDIKSLVKAREYGVVKLNKNLQLVEFFEKPKKPESKLVAMCLYYFPRQKLNLVSDYLKSKVNKHDATGFYIEWLKNREQVFGYVFSGRWYDIGHKEFYHKANRDFKKVV